MNCFIAGSSFVFAQATSVGAVETTSVLSTTMNDATPVMTITHRCIALVTARLSGCLPRRSRSLQVRVGMIDRVECIGPVDDDPERVTIDLVRDIDEDTTRERTPRKHH